MTISWITPAGNLGTVTERVPLDIQLQASSDVGFITFSVISGRLPRGLRVHHSTDHDSSVWTGFLRGSPTEVKKFTTSRFVIRASDGQDIEDRTFSLSVDGSDAPQWITKEGFLNIGPNNAYYVLDNAYVNFQLDVYDPDLIAGDTLEYFLIPSGGELPPGLTLTKSGRITGFTDPVFALEYNDSRSGAYDTGTFDTMPLDLANNDTAGFDSYIYDLETFDYNETTKAPRRLSRFYTFIVAVTDGVYEVRRLFRIWVITDEFLKSDNSLIQVDTNLFQADGDGTRKPIWITESNLGRVRANNFVTFFLDVYDPPSLEGVITYFKLPTNPDGSISVFPPGMTLDTLTGEVAGRVPYQAAVTKTYQFTLEAVSFPPVLFEQNYTLLGTWSSTINYKLGDAVRYGDYLWVCLQDHRFQIPEDGVYWDRGVSTSAKTFTVNIIGEIESAIEWITDPNLGTIPPNIPSDLYVKAETKLYGGRTIYELDGGLLPPGLELVSSGLIQGKVKQFADDAGPGLTRFYEKTDSSIDESTRSRDFSLTFDESETTFDRQFTFHIKASDAVNVAENVRTFTLLVSTKTNLTFANLYAKAFQSKGKRLDWYNFITDSDLFKDDEIYRYGDPNFGIQPELKMLIYAGIESRDAEYFVQAMSRNHYRKQVKFGGLKSAVAKDPVTQQVIYEVVYVEIIDEFEKNGTSISKIVQLPNNINSKVLVNYDAIKVDSDIPFASDSDHQRLFPNSYKNMRSRIKGIGERDREFLPLWMRSIQPDTYVEPGWVKSVVLCYLKPGYSSKVMARIKNKTTYASRGDWNDASVYQIEETVQYNGDVYKSKISNNTEHPSNEASWLRNFHFRSINFTIDRYLIDVISGTFENKYLAFSQRGEKLP